MTDEKDRESQSQRQREKQKKRSLHRKHKDRRKKDVVPNLPFIIGFQGDPAMDFRCEDVHGDSGNQLHIYRLNPIYGENRGLRRLSTYFSKKITRLHMGQVLIYKAGDDDKKLLWIGIGLMIFGIFMIVCCSLVLLIA